MMSDKVVTNIRMDRDDWMMIKSMAAANDMSFNEYISFLVMDLNINKALGVNMARTSIGAGRRKKMELKNFALDVVKNDKPMGLGKDDELIYG